MHENLQRMICAYRVGEDIAAFLDPSTRYYVELDGSAPFERATQALVESLFILEKPPDSLWDRLKEIARKWKAEMEGHSGDLLRLMWTFSGLAFDGQVLKDEPETLAQVLGRLISLELHADPPKDWKDKLTDEDFWEPISKTLSDDSTTDEKISRLLAVADKVYRSAACAGADSEYLPSKDEDLETIVREFMTCFERNRALDSSLRGQSSIWKMDPLRVDIQTFGDDLLSWLFSILLPSERMVLWLAIGLYYLCDHRRGIPDGLLVQQAYLAKYEVTSSRYMYVFQLAQDLGKALEQNAHIPDAACIPSMLDESAAPVEELMVKRGEISLWARQRSEQLMTYLTLQQPSVSAQTALPKSLSVSAVPGERSVKLSVEGETRERILLMKGHGEQWDARYHVFRSFVSKLSEDIKEHKAGNKRQSEIGWVSYETLDPQSPHKVSGRTRTQVARLRDLLRKETPDLFVVSEASREAKGYRLEGTVLTEHWDVHVDLPTE